MAQCIQIDFAVLLYDECLLYMSEPDFRTQVTLFWCSLFDVCHVYIVYYCGSMNGSSEEQKIIFNVVLGH